MLQTLLMVTVAYVTDATDGNSCICYMNTDDSSDACVTGLLRDVTPALRDCYEK